jgi:hypothetical protein
MCALHKGVVVVIVNQLNLRSNPSTLTSINYLALVLSDQDKYGQAEEIHRQELRLTETVLGKEHPSTLTSMDNLALVLKGRGENGVDRANQLCPELDHAPRTQVLWVKEYVGGAVGCTPWQDPPKQRGLGYKTTSLARNRRAPAQENGRMGKENECRSSPLAWKGLACGTLFSLQV